MKDWETNRAKSPAEQEDKHTNTSQAAKRGKQVNVPKKEKVHQRKQQQIKYATTLHVKDKRLQDLSTEAEPEVAQPGQGKPARLTLQRKPLKDDT